MTALSRLQPLGRRCALVPPPLGGIRSLVAARPCHPRWRQPWCLAASNLSPRPGAVRGKASAAEEENIGKAQDITWQGIYANLGLTGAKMVGGVAGNSSALIADAVHSFSDLLSDFVTLATVKVARAPPNEKNPYGHGRFEALGALAVSGVLICSGGGILIHSASLMLELLPLGDMPSWAAAVLGHVVGADQAAAPEAPGAIALGVAALSIGVKEVLYQRTMVIANETKSAVLAANAWHHRTDSLSSIVALFGIGLAKYGYPLFDPLAGMMVGGMILKAAVADIGVEAVRELTDASIEPEVRERAVQWAETVEGVERVARLRSRQMGPYSHVDMVIEVHPHLSVTTAHQIAQRVRSALIEQSSGSSECIVTNANVYAQPAQSHTVSRDTPLWADPASPSEELSGFRPHTEVVQEVRAALRIIPQIREVSHCLVHYIDGKMSVQVDIVVDAHHKVGDVHAIAAAARRKLLSSIPDLSEADVELELDENDKGDLYAKLAQTPTQIRVGGGRQETPARPMPYRSRE